MFTKLVKLLKQVEGNEYITCVYNEEENREFARFPEELIVLAEEIDEEASALLIGRDGRPNYEAMAELKKLGYEVVPGETDSFGWLTGCIVTKKGEIVYG